MGVRPSPAVLRAGEILDLLALDPGRALSVSELSRQLALPRATCDTVLRALEASGLVRRDPQLRYELGVACITLGDAARVANPALRAASGEAERLALGLHACTLVSIRDGEETRVATVFDHGPPFGLRARVGEAVQLVPPFGASFVAWAGEVAVESWLGRAEPPLDPAERRSYRDALAAVQARGFSFTVVTDRQPSLIAALERLAEQGVDEARRERDEAVRRMTHSEYLTIELDRRHTYRLAQVSAPVFGPDTTVVAVIMLLGPNGELSGEDITELGRVVRGAADRATAASGGTLPH